MCIHTHTHTHNMVSKMMKGEIASELKESNRIGKKSTPCMGFLEEKKRETPALHYGATWRKHQQK